MSLAPFDFAGAGRVMFAPGKAKDLGKVGPLRKAQRVVFVSDQGLSKAGLVDEVKAGLGTKVVHTDLDAVPDASVPHVDALAQAIVQHDADAVVALGGGSVLDTAKAAAAVAKKGGSVRDLVGFATVRAQLLPIVAVPTTAGTGAEATQFVVVKDHDKGIKLILMDTSMVPAQAVLDPELCTSLPETVTAHSGVDALTHAVEALASRQANPLGDAYALRAVQMIVQEDALAQSLSEPGDVDARGRMMVAAHLAGQAITTNMLGACHAFAHALGAAHGTPHGLANGLFLAPTMRLNLEKATRKYALLGRVLGGSGSDRALAEHAIAEVERAVHQVAKIPETLSALGITADDVPRLVKLTMKDPDLMTNPVQLQDPDRAAEIIGSRL